MPAETNRPQQGDEYALFVRYDARLHAATFRATGASREDIDDACAYAWMQLVRHQPRRETVYPWLLTVSRREATRLRDVAQGHRYDPVDGLEPMLPDRVDPIAGAEAVMDGRHRLSELSERGRKTVFLHGAGYTYADIADELGVSPQRVQKVGSRALNHLRNIERDRAKEDPAVPPELRLLNQLRRDPPVFLQRAIGRCPNASPKRGGEERRLQWSRLTMRIVRFRVDRGIDDPFHALGRDDGRTPDPRRVALLRDITTFAHGRKRGRDEQGIDR